MRAAILQNETVINVIVVDDLTFNPGAGFELVSAENNDAHIDWERQPDGTFTDPNAESEL